MATVYKNRGIWYITVSNGKRRITRSLKTKDKKVAKKLKHMVEFELLYQLSNFSMNIKNLPFDQLIKKYLKADHYWSKRTIELNHYVFKSYLSGKPLPKNPTSRAIFVRTINSCWNWGKNKNLITKTFKLEGDTKGETRKRVIHANELKKLLNNIEDISFNLFVQFAYYTGARSGEIRCISKENIFSNYIAVYGKSGQRIVKLNQQAQKIIKQIGSPWNYSKDFVSHKFKKEARKVNINDIRFHDLRRTFGYNLIKQGRPIYEVSKLLGHSSVITTEKHYAPLLTTEIDDFVL